MQSFDRARSIENIRQCMFVITACSGIKLFKKPSLYKLKLSKCTADNNWQRMLDIELLLYL
jgi:hypothetical protein